MILILFIQYKNPKKTKNKKLVKMFNKIFNFLSKIHLFSAKLQNIRVRIYNNTLGEDWLIKYRTVLYLFVSWGVWIFTIVFVLIYFKNNLYVTFTLLFFSFQVKEIVLDMLIGNDTNFLIGIYNYSIELQQAFSLTKDVRGAILEANNHSNNYNLVKRMEEIEKILDDHEAIEEYMQECPNDYLKLLIINCNLVNENGDKKDVDGKSVFLENIFYNNENIETEVFKRRQLEYWLRGMTIICIIPLLAFSPYEMWSNKMLPITDVFYKTKLGFITKIIITLLALLCFYIIKSFEKINRKRSIKEKAVFWEEVFFRVPIIKKIMLKIVPKQNSIKGYKYKNLISQSGEYTRVEYIYLKKVLFAVIGFIMSMSICISVHGVTKNSILENRTSEFSKSIIVANEGQQDSTTIENELLKEVELNDVPGTYERLKDKIKHYGITENTDIIVTKVISKKIAIEKENVSIYDILISLLVMLVSYKIPEFMLKMKFRMRKYEMQNEVIIFETIILIFMYHESATSEVILENMAKFADIFKPQVDKVLKEIRKSDFEALEILLEELKYKPFLSIIKNLIKAENIKTKDAFISLADNRRNYLMNRKEDNRRFVYKSVSKSRMISLIPINLVIIAYIAIPMMYVAFSQLNTTQNQLINIETQQKN